MPFFKSILKYLMVLCVLLFFITGNTQALKSPQEKIADLKVGKDFSKQDSVYIDLLLSWAKDLEFKNKDSMYLLLRQGLDLSQSINYQKGLSTGYVYLGDYYVDSEPNSEKSSLYYNQALEIATKNNFDQVSVVLYTSYGRKLYIEGNYSEALLKWLKGMELAKKLNNQVILGILYNNIASLYQNIEEYQTALDYFTKAKDVGKAENDTILFAKILRNIAHTQVKLNLYSEAESQINQAIEFFSQEEMSDWLVFSYEVKGDIAYAKGNYREAINWFLKGINICTDLGYETYKIPSYNGISGTYIQLKEPQKALNYASKAYAIAKKSDSHKGVETASKHLSTAYRKLGDFEKALLYQDKYYELETNSQSEKIKKALGFFRSEQKFEEEKVRLMEFSNAALEKQKRLKFVFFISFLVLTALLLLTYLNFTTQKKFNTLLKEKQEVLLQNESNLIQINKTKDKLFSIIAHDLRGPINSFYGLLDVYLKGGFSKSESEYILPKALKEIGSIKEMLNNLLVWGQTQINSNFHKPTNVNLNRIINDIISFVEPMASKKQIGVKLKIKEYLWSYSDENFLRVILRNLLSNAIKFTNTNGEILVEVTQTSDVVQIAIKDTGIGMTKEAENRLFLANNFETTYGTHKEKGTGLGLALCKELVTVNGGTIWVVSELNQGSTFYFTAPLKKLDA